MCVCVCVCVCVEEGHGGLTSGSCQSQRCHVDRHVNHVQEEGGKLEREGDIRDEKSEI